MTFSFFLSHWYKPTPLSLAFKAAILSKCQTQSLLVGGMYMTAGLVGIRFLGPALLRFVTAMMLTSSSNHFKVVVLCLHIFFRDIMTFPSHHQYSHPASWLLLAPSLAIKLFLERRFSRPILLMFNLIGLFTFHYYLTRHRNSWSKSK